MKWTGLNELRESFLSFFESKQHYRHPSAPLVPQDDGSLLLINSGMAPLKNYFLGLATPPSKRMTTCQKCIRTPDIEEVGKTSRHGTYFEMLGNFSFGDYFKEEATQWAWEFLTQVIDIPEELLWVTVYQDDDEAFDIWTQKRGVSADKLVRMGKKDNFWEIGSGPCGPCSEIYFDRGEAYGCDAEICGIGHCECDRYMEIWNLVFTQFNSDGAGTYTPLEHPNIDTGMGLERLACVMQGVDNLFEVDTLQNIMNKVSEISGVAYKTKESTDISLRVITDHIRSTVFMVGDGVIPSNEGRGYVLRRLLRRAARHGHLLGVNKPFLQEVCDVVIEENKAVYPELLENATYIKKIISAEEERFSTTIQQGMEALSAIIDRLEVDVVGNIIGGEQVFQLYDTFGFPIDLTREIAADRGVVVDEEGFRLHMEEQRKRARKAHAEQGGIGWEEDVLADTGISDRFLGYDQEETTTDVLAIIKEGTLVESALDGQEVILVVGETPFYAESGGQVGDTGTITTEKGGVFTVTDCQKSPTGHILHIGKMTTGTMEKGSAVTARVDSARRTDIRRNHTATHLLQAELRKMLGEHVHQAGSYVSGELLRFDFTHFSPVSRKELQKLEDEVNKRIVESHAVGVEEMPIAEAKAKGAMALFGDKYSDVVRVCTVEDGTSVELCGGIHVNNTAQIGLFKIVSESSIAAGVRRIEAVTGNGILRLLEHQTAVMRSVGQTFKVNAVEEMIPRALAIAEEIGNLRITVKELETKIAGEKTANFGENMIQIGAVRLAAMAIAGNIEPLQERADAMKEKAPDMVGVLIAMGDDSATALVFAGKDAVKAGIHCGKLVKELAAIGGGSGGGRPDNAKGGIPDIGKVDDALSAAKDLVAAQLA